MNNISQDKHKNIVILSGFDVCSIHFRVYFYYCGRKCVAFTGLQEVSKFLLSEL